MRAKHVCFSTRDGQQCTKQSASSHTHTKTIRGRLKLEMVLYKHTHTPPMTHGDKLAKQVRNSEMFQCKQTPYQTTFQQWIDSKVDLTLREFNVAVQFLRRVSPRSGPFGSSKSSCRVPRLEGKSRCELPKGWPVVVSLLVLVQKPSQKIR